MPYYLRLDPPVKPGDDGGGIPAGVYPASSKRQTWCGAGMTAVGDLEGTKEEFKGSSNVCMTADTPPALELHIFWLQVIGYGL
jgi:hypothetical protein